MTKQTQIGLSDVMKGVMFRLKLPLPVGMPTLKVKPKIDEGIGKLQGIGF